MFLITLQGRSKLIIQCTCNVQTLKWDLGLPVVTLALVLLNVVDQVYTRIITRKWDRGTSESDNKNLAGSNIFSL